MAFIPEDMIVVTFTKEEAEYLSLLFDKVDRGSVLARIYHKVKTALDSNSVGERKE